MVGVADRDRQRVGGVVGPRRRGQAQQRLHHPLRLVLLRAAAAAHRPLDLLRRVVAARHAALAGRDEHRPARLPDRKGGPYVLAEEQGLERDGVGLVRDEQVAEDLINEVFLDVWRQAGKFEGRSAVSTWLLAITRFKALSALRRRSDVELDDEAAGAIEDASDDPEVAVQKKDTGEVLRKCLMALSPEHREIVDLVYYHEKSVEEVGEIVGIPENTVKTRLFYARKKLAGLLKAAGVERGWP